MSIGRKMTVVGFRVIVIGVGLVAFRLAAQDRVGSLPTGEPQLTVSNRGVLLSWIEHAGSRTTLRFAERTPNGWTEPRTVASGQDWSVNAIGG
ncbi:MAG: hypothetical protein DMG13_34865 [Acidobacteria bacterium]|nr:MAG: hypothetical protein DMG13_34865 [Acidobacteriota bacterium]